MSQHQQPSIFIGDIFETNEGGKVEVIDYINSKNIIIRHMDEFGFETKTTGTELRAGKLKNPYRRSVYGVGYFGVGKHKSRYNSKKSLTYLSWKSMMRRCYDEKLHERQPSYKDCKVCTHWHNFQNFADWFEYQYHEEKWELDKDLIIKGSKIYSPETCTLVPSEINTLLVNRERDRGDLPLGVKLNYKGFSSSLNMKNKNIYLGTFSTPEEAFQAYKKAKEKYIKEKAEEYKDKLDPKVYQFLMEYEVEP